ncbi:MAG: alpha-N-arabinofuranosidase, partial [Planctomycetota bacterium]
CIKTSKTAAAFETTGLVLKLYRDNFGTIPAAVTGDAPATAGLDVSAAWATDRKALTIAVVNPTQQGRELAIDLKGAQLDGTGQLWVIAHSDPMAYNEPGAEPNVVIEEKPFAGPADKLNVPPLSVSLYKMAAKN